MISHEIGVYTVTSRTQQLTCALARVNRVFRKVLRALAAKFSSLVPDLTKEILGQNFFINKTLFEKKSHSFQVNHSNEHCEQNLFTIVKPNWILFQLVIVVN